MKKILFLITICFCMGSSYAQGITNATYYETRGYLAGQGYTIADDKYADLAEGETMYLYRTFYSGVQYKIYGFSDDADVSDLDLYIYNSSGLVYTKDDEPNATPYVVFTPSYTRRMKIVLKNVTSDTPDYESRCRFFIAYK